VVQIQPDRKVMEESRRELTALIEKSEELLERSRQLQQKCVAQTHRHEQILRQFFQCNQQLKRDSSS
jgi:hypothetical protein